MQVASNKQSPIKSCEDAERPSIEDAAARSISPATSLQNLSADSSSLSPVSTHSSDENNTIENADIPPLSIANADALAKALKDPDNLPFDSLYQAAATASSALAIWQNEYFALAHKVSIAADTTSPPTIPTHSNPQRPISPPLYSLLLEDSLYSLPPRPNPLSHRYDGLPPSQKQLELEARKAKMTPGGRDAYESQRIEALRVWPGVESREEKSKSKGKKRRVEEVEGDVIVEGPRVRRRTCKVEEAEEEEVDAEAPAPKPKPKKGVTAPAPVAEPPAPAPAPPVAGPSSPAPAPAQNKSKGKKRSAEEMERDPVVEGLRVRRRTRKVQEAEEEEVGVEAPAAVAEPPAPAPATTTTTTTAPAPAPVPAPTTAPTPTSTTTTVNARGRPVNKTRSEAMAAAWAKRKAEGTNGRKGGAPIGKGRGKKGKE